MQHERKNPAPSRLNCTENWGRAYRTSCKEGLKHGACRHIRDTPVSPFHSFPTHSTWASYEQGAEAQSERSVPKLLNLSRGRPRLVVVTKSNGRYKSLPWSRKLCRAEDDYEFAFYFASGELRGNIPYRAAVDGFKLLRKFAADYNFTTSWRGSCQRFQSFFYSMG